MKQRASRAIRAAMITAGITLAFVPSLLFRVHRAQNENLIAAAMIEARENDRETLEKRKEEAVQWNAELVAEGAQTVLSAAGRDQVESDYSYEAYASKLDWMDEGIMGVLRIPAIDCELPIYHGTGEEALASGAGHIPWSALPVGGIGNRTVLSSHRGMAQAELFTRLDELKKGDLLFVENPLETLVYEVTDQQVILPQEAEQLAPRTDEDLLTLMTCTPYGINTHRLLVNAKRIEADQKKDVKKLEESADERVPGWRTLALDAWPFCLLMMAGIVVVWRHRNKPPRL